LPEIVAIVIAGPDRGVKLSVGDGIDVGAAPGSALQLTDPAVSDRHLRIFHEGSELRVEGVAGSDTQLNGERLDRARTLRLGDKLLLGSTLLEVVSADTAAALIPARPSLRVEPGRPQFIPEEFYEAPAGDGSSRFGALGSWTDSRVKLQTEVAAFGLLAVSAGAVYLFVL
jgi:hypothetical protein